MFKFIAGAENRTVYIKIDNLNVQVAHGIRQGFFDVGRDLLNTASKEMLKGKKTGNVYIIRGPSGRRRRHKASAPGETPANLTGTLRRSLGWKARGVTELEFGYGVSDSRAAAQQAPFYADWMEFGTPKGKIKPRPGLGNAIKAVQKNIENYLENNIVDSIKKG